MISRFVRVFLFVSILVLACQKQEGFSQSAQTPAETWLSISTEGRARYVEGYLSGFERAKRLACQFYEIEKMKVSSDSVPIEKRPLNECLKSVPSFGEKYYQVYVDKITNYYEKYPKDREASVSRILIEFATDSRTSIEQVHNKISGVVSER